jgi:hypothetical protein
MSAQTPVSIVHSSHVFETIVNRGVSFFDGLKEAVDNAIDWGARNIRIHAVIDEQERMTIRIADDAYGIPDWVMVDKKTGEGLIVSSPADGEGVINGLQHAMRMGGRIERRGRTPNGRFGFGLPQTAIAFECVTKVYTRTVQHTWRNMTVSREILEAAESEDGRIWLPDLEFTAPTEEETPHGWKFAASGTMVSFVDVPLKRHRFPNTDLLFELLSKDLGQTYRYPIRDDLNIVITTENETALDPILLRDPMCMMENSIEYEKFGPVSDEMNHEIIFDGTAGNRPPIKDPGTDDFAKVTVRCIRVEPKLVRQALGIPLDAGVRATVGKFSKWGFDNDGQGFSLVRGVREIGHSENFGLYGKHATLNYFRGEIHFPPIPELDRYFGVEPNKSKHNLTQLMKDWLGAVGLTINSYSTKTVKALKEMNPTKSNRGKGRIKRPRPANQPSQIRQQAQHERATQAVIDVAPPRKTTKSDEELRQARLALEEGDFDALSTDYEKRKQEYADELKRAQLVDDDYHVKDVEHRIKGLKDDYVKAQSEMKARFGDAALFRTHERDIIDDVDSFYEPVVTDQGISIKLSRKHPLYYSAYTHARDNNPDMWLLMETMMYGIAYADADPTHSPEKRAFWDRIRPLIGRTSRLMLTLLDEEEEEEDEPEQKRTKYQVVQSICEMTGIPVPDKIKGSTVPKDFLKDLIISQNSDIPAGATKPDLFRTAVKLTSPSENAEIHLSRGGTVRLSGLLALEDALQGRN